MTAAVSRSFRWRSVFRATTPKARIFHRRKSARIPGTGVSCEPCPRYLWFYWSAVTRNAGIWVDPPGWPKRSLTGAGMRPAVSRCHIPAGGTQVGYGEIHGSRLIYCPCFAGVYGTYWTIEFPLVAALVGAIAVKTVMARVHANFFNVQRSPVPESSRGISGILPVQPRPAARFRARDDHHPGMLRHGAPDPLEGGLIPVSRWR